MSRPVTRRRRQLRRSVSQLLPLEPRQLMSATYYVSAGAGNDANTGTSDAAAFATLQRAANAVTSPGDTVIVRAGTYTAGFQLGWDATPSGSAAAPIRFLADPGTVITGKNNKSADGIDLEPGCNYIDIEGFTVNNASGTITRAGIRVTGSDHVTVRNNTADDCGTWGIFSGYANDLLIEHNVASHAQTQHGIYVSNSGDRPIIRGNTVFGNYDCGIHMNGGYYGTDGQDGIISGAVVEGNVIYDNGAGGGSGINCDGVQDSVFRDNLLYNNHASGISLFQQDGGGASTNDVVENNTIVQAANARWALNITNASTGAKVFNNILYNTPRGAISLSADSAPGFVSDYNAVVSRFSADDGGSFISLAQWQAQTGQDLHSVAFSDPTTLFANIAGNDYRLKPGAPAVDAGVASFAGVNATALDLAGLVRPQGGGMDIGAYELPAAPLAPSNLVGLAVSSTQVNLTWTDNSNNETAFVVEQSTDGAHWSAVTTTAANTTTYSVTGLSPATAYFFRVRATDASGPSANALAGPVTTPSLLPIASKLTGTAYGTAGSWSNLGNTFAKAFDNDLTTFFDAPGGNGDYVGLDLGTPATVSAIQFAPRAGAESRMVGGRFQGSNVSATSGFVDLYTITTAPAAGALTTATLTNPASYRFVRYLSPDNGYGNIAELEFDGAPTVTPPPLTGTKLAGNAFGTPGSWNNSGNTYLKAFDGSTSTFFDAPSADGDYLGLDLGTPATISAIRFAPRAGAESRMIGGRFQGSNLSPTSGFVDLFTVGVAPIAGTLTAVPVTDPTAYRYVRYLAPNGSYGNIAEIEFDGAASTTPPTGTLLTGAAFGAAGSWNNSGNTFAKALDGDLSTFFDAPTANGNSVGLDLGTPTVITSIEYAPRPGYESRMIGGRFQGSNTSATAGFVDLYTIDVAPTAGALTEIAVQDPTAYRYVRYLAPDNSYGNIAELAFFS